MSEKPKVSLFAASVRPHLWKPFFDSLKATDIPFEIVFAGNLRTEEISGLMPSFEKPDQFFHYLPTGNIKPAQAYEVAQRACEGELLHWTADDAEYSPHFLDHAWETWENFGDHRVLLSCQTIEDGNFVVLTRHRLFGGHNSSPQMAPLGFMSRKFLDEVGGYDRRYISGQSENDLVMRAMNAGGRMILFTEHGEISLDHRKKHGGNSGPFRSAYPHDRQVLEGAWAPYGRYHIWGPPPFKRYDGGFEPFDHLAPDFLTVSQSHKGMWE